MTGRYDALLDDAAVFPPGSLPLSEAVASHVARRSTPYAGLVGPLVVGAQHLGGLAEEVRGLPERSLAISVVSPLGSVCEALRATDAIRQVVLVGLEVAPPEGRAGEAVTRLRTLVRDRPVEVYVEVPRDQRRADVIAALAASPYRAKLRTGGVVAGLHPSADELAASVAALVAAAVPFKATAGLHHAVRNTDPVTGFEQHGFLNLMLAVDAAHRGAPVGDLVHLLEERDARRVAELAARLPTDVRDWFRSFGTCSVDEPVADLVALGLIPAPAVVR